MSEGFKLKKSMLSFLLLNYLLLFCSVSCYIDSGKVHEAIRVGDVEKIQKSLNRLNVNETINGELPLVTAAKYNQFEVFKLLIDNGADVYSDYEPGYPLAFWLTVKAKEREVRYLIENGFDVNTRREETGSTLMHIAINIMSQDFMGYLIEKGYRLELMNNEFQTPLALAILHNRIDSAIFLINSGADINYSNANKSSIWVDIALYVDDRNIELADIVYEHGGEIVNEGRENGLFAAVEKGRYGLIIWLLKHGADPLVEDSNRCIPIDYAYMLTNNPEGSTRQDQVDIFNEVYSALIEFGSREPIVF